MDKHGGDDTKGGKAPRGRKPRIPHPVQGLRVVAGQDVEPGAVGQPLAKGQGRNAHGLTTRAEAFAVQVAKGATLAAAYRAAYTADGMRPETVWSNASRLMADDRVQARVDALVRAGEAVVSHDVGQTRRAVLDKLLATMMDGRVAPAVQLRAAELLGKTVALFVDRTETTTITADQGADAVQGALEAKLAALLQAG